MRYTSKKISSKHPKPKNHKLARAQKSEKNTEKARKKVCNEYACGEKVS